jgi:hypothetical protein
MLESLYVYVGNNPLEYIDPTGHGKETPEQEAVEEGAVGGVLFSYLLFVAYTLQESGFD